jgi:hypothetical protein
LTVRTAASTRPFSSSSSLPSSEVVPSGYRCIPSNDRERYPSGVVQDSRIGGMTKQKACSRAVDATRRACTISWSARRHSQPVLPYSYSGYLLCLSETCPPKSRSRSRIRICIHISACSRSLLNSKKAPSSFPLLTLNLICFPPPPSESVYDIGVMIQVENISEWQATMSILLTEIACYSMFRAL